MAGSSMMQISSPSLCSLVLAVFIASVTFSQGVTAVDNGTSIWNNLASYKSHPVYVRCSYIFDSHRYVEPVGTLLPPGATRNISNIPGNYPGVKRVECNIVWYFSSGATYKNLLKAVVWTFNGPSETRFGVNDVGLYYAVPPNLGAWIGTGLTIFADLESYWIPSFLATSSLSSTDSSKVAVLATSSLSSTDPSKMADM